jgi:hypothetical protein
MCRWLRPGAGCCCGSIFVIKSGENRMEIAVSIFAVIVGVACFYAIYRSDKKDMDKGKEEQSDS